MYKGKIYNLKWIPWKRFLWLKLGHESMNLISIIFDQLHIWISAKHVSERFQIYQKYIYALTYTQFQMLKKVPIMSQGFSSGSCRRHGSLQKYTVMELRLGVQFFFFIKQLHKYDWYIEGTLKSSLRSIELSKSTSPDTADWGIKALYMSLLYQDVPAK